MRLRHLVTIGPRPHNVPSLPPDAGVTFVTMEALADGLGGLDASQTRPLSEVASGYNYFTEGDLLLAKVTPCFENGKKAFAKRLSNAIGYATTEVYVIRPNVHHICPKYLFYLLCSEDFRAAGMASMTGAGGLRRVSVAAILNYRLGVTDLPTQKVISDFLDRETTRIDQLIEKKQRMVDLAEKRWYTILDNAVCGRSNLALKRRVANTFVKEIPDHWILSPLKHLTDDRRPIMYGIVLPGPNVEDGPMIVKGGDVKPGRLKPERLCRTTFTIERSHTRSRLKAGDLVIAIRGGIGDVEIIPPEINGANLTQDAARIAPGNDVSNKWLRYALQAPSVFAPLEARALGAAVSGINIFDLKRVQVPTPPLDEQVEIATNLAVEERRINNLTNLFRRYSVVIREFRAALITAAVTGQIDVSTWGKQGMSDRRLDQIEEATSA